jgi:hypothetical protein
MPDYTEEQRAIIHRMGEISSRHRVAMEADRVAHVTMSRDLLHLGTELSAAIRRSNEIGKLEAEYGDAFREFLDTL